jgi:putative glutamine amidotransferase
VTVVGIVGHHHAVPRPFGVLPVTGSPTAYVEGISAAGGRPVLLPGSLAPALLDVVDALVLTGGGDVDPTLYGGRPDAATGVDRERDEAEIALIRAAATARVPLLAVCRGMQLLAVSFGGGLASDLGDRHLKHPDGHPVHTAPGSLVESLVGPTASVTSLHHQAVRRPGTPWRMTAWAEDGTAEAMEWTGEEPWSVLGVQWHPELDDPTGPRLFTWLVRAAHRASGGLVRL